MRKLYVLFHAMIMLLIVSLSSCTTNDVRKVELDNSFALSLFSDTISLEQLLNSMDPMVTEWINIDEDGSLYAYYADSVINAVTGEDLLGGIEDLTFDVSSEFEVPDIPASPIPVPLNWTFDDLVSIPFAIEGYSINSVLLRSGRLAFGLSTDLSVIESVELKTDNIKLADGSSLTIKLDTKNNDADVDVNLEKCIISPENNKITFSVAIFATISDKPIGGDYDISLKGGITDLKFETIDGTIENLRYDFIGAHDINFGIVNNISGDFTIATPMVDIRYINSFGFNAKGIVDSLYLKTIDGGETSLIKDWNQLEMTFEPTNGNYASIADFPEQITNAINIVEDYNQIRFSGNIVVGCDDLKTDMISYDSHIDVVANVKMPMKFTMDELRYLDTMDVNITITGNDSDSDVFDELEFKFMIENGLPIQLIPRLYMVQEGVIIDSLFTDNACINGCFDGKIVKDYLVVSVVEEKINSVLSSDQFILDLRFSTEGNMAVMNAKDEVNLWIGLKTKTTEITL